MTSEIFHKIQLNILLPQKDRRGDIVFWSAVFAAFQITLRFAGGFFLGFMSAQVSAAAVLSAFVTVLLREFLRAVLLRFLAIGKRFRIPACLAVALVIAAADLIWNSVIRIPNTGLLIFQIAEAIAGSLLLTALSYKGLFAASFLFAFFTQVFTAALPFEPGLPVQLSLLINTVLAMMFLIVLDCAFGKSEKLRREKRKPKGVRIALTWVACALFVTVMAFFCGLLPVHPVSVATGSMQPDIAIGDVLLVRNCDMENVKIGDVIQFRYDGKTVMHRVVEAETVNGETHFITKGDANNANDTGSVSAENLVGKVIGKVPQIGKLTLWLHSE